MSRVSFVPEPIQSRFPSKQSEKCARLLSFAKREGDHLSEYSRPIHRGDESNFPSTERPKISSVGALMEEVIPGLRQIVAEEA